MNPRTVLAALIGLGLLGAAAVGAWYLLHEHAPAFCELSGRPIHANMHTVVQVNGKTRHACCARCALILASQTDQQVEIREVTDYVTARRLPAADAYYVEGSQVEVCSAPRLRVDESRMPYLRLFDRCSPSLLAFARENEARDFRSNYGGSLKRLDALIREARPQPLPEGDR